ncbi:MAG: WD40/YVTN/BNR-like repeat-containing protein [Myxococcaceae bacterium]
MKRALLMVVSGLLYGCSCSTQPVVACESDGDCKNGFFCAEDKTCMKVEADGGCSAAAPCPAGELCANALCFPTSCEGTQCAEKEICQQDHCVPALCGGVLCPPGQECAGGVCLPTGCAGVSCPPGDVCDHGACVDASCVGVSCPPPLTCANGLCLGATCAGAQCPPGTVCDREKCVEAACAGVNCTLGGTCVAGLCRFPACGSANCADGFICTSQGLCVSIACANVACPGGSVCNGGLCYPLSCGASPCPPGQVCDESSCVDQRCAGVVCGAGDACAADGKCYPRSCGATACKGIFVCVANECTDPHCVGMTCPGGTVCGGGTCWPRDPPTGPPCGTGKAYLSGACQELLCLGMQCPTGESCLAGVCSAGNDVFPAGWVQPSGTTNAALWKGVVARFEEGRWVRLNQTDLPPITQLVLSPDGQFFYAVSSGGSFFYSGDGVNWIQRWQGDATNGYMMYLDVNAASGRLYGAIRGPDSFDGIGKVIVSSDHGDSWSHFWTTPYGGFGSHSQGTGFASSPVDPKRMWACYLDGYAWAPKACGVSVNGGASFTKLFDVNPQYGVVAHPTDSTKAFIFTTNLIREDAGVSGPFATTAQNLQFKLTDPSIIFAATGAKVFKSTNGGDSWAARTLGLPPTANLSQLAQRGDSSLYAGSRAAGTEVLFRSADDGETWQDVSQGMTVTPGVVDPLAAWTPELQHIVGDLIVPSALNGHRYRCTVAGTSGDGGEPAWPLDAGAIVVDGTVRWAENGSPSAMRAAAVAARLCPLGQVRCGNSCVPIAVDPKSCGGCGRACASGVGCYLATCLGALANPIDAGVPDPDGGVLDAGPVDAGQVTGLLAGITIGCADGTREGFLDVLAYPKIAACAGGWTGELSAQSAAPLCGAGWHPCEHGDPVVHTLSYAQATSFPGCFAYLASNDFGDGCEPLDCRAPTGNPAVAPTYPIRDDIAGMGASCVNLSGVSIPPAGMAASQAGGCLLDKGLIDTQCCAITDAVRMAPRPAGCLQRGETGVLCCQ